MWQSAMLSDEKNVIRVQQALSRVDGDARIELQKVKRELDGQRRNLSRNIEGAAASGFESTEMERSSARLSKTLTIIEAALLADGMQSRK